MKNFLNRKLVGVGVGALVAGVGMTAGVFAAIPDSNNGLITGCRNNNTSALKVIDAQNGAACGANETTLSWWSSSTVNSGPAPKSAIIRMAPNPDTSDTDFPAVYDAARSRGVVAIKKLVANDPVGNPTDNRGYCVELGFTVLYSDEQSGSVVSYEAGNPGIQQQIDAACGSGYDVYLAPYDNGKAVLLSE